MNEMGSTKVKRGVAGMILGFMGWVLAALSTFLCAGFWKIGQRAIDYLKIIEGLIPPTFYSDRPLAERVARITDAWREAIRACGLTQRMLDQADIADQHNHVKYTEMCDRLAKAFPGNDTYRWEWVERTGVSQSEVDKAQGDARERLRKIKADYDAGQAAEVIDEDHPPHAAFTMRMP